jgi:uncharacterized protein (TIGR02145 family)
MTGYQRNAIFTPVVGLVVYQIDGSTGFYYYDGDVWIFLGQIDGDSGNVIDADGNGYPTVLIGEQEWMSENLKVTHYQNGDAIPNVIDNSSWNNLITGAYCWYNNDEDYKEVYGALYNWFSVNDDRKLCPVGWRLPTDAEWSDFTSYLGGFSVAGGKMKTINLWVSPNTGATNSTGYSGLPGGFRRYDGQFFVLEYNGFWWTATEDGNNNAWTRQLNSDNSNLNRGSSDKNYGFSVRCVRD